MGVGGVIVFAGQSLVVRDAPQSGLGSHRLKVSTTSTVGEVLDADQVRDLRDRLAEWLEDRGR